MTDTQDFTAYMSQQGYSKSTISFHIKAVGKLTQWLDRDHIEAPSATYNDIMAYIKYRRQQGTGKLGVSRYVTAIKNYYTYLCSIGQSTTNPVLSIKIQGLPRKKLYDILSPHELTSLYQRFARQGSPESAGHARDTALAGLAVFQGLNTTDLSRLEPQHINLREGTIYIPSTRRGNERTLQLEPVQVMEMYHYVQVAREQLLNGQKQDTLFFSATGKSTVHHVIKLVVGQLQKQSPRIKSLLHIRASVIVKWLKKHRLRKAQYMAGHRHISSTEQYQINDLEGLQEEVQQFHPLG